MASLRTPTGIEGGGNLIKVLKLTAVVTGDTIFFGGPVKSWVGVNTTTADALNVTYSSTTQLFTLIVANTPDCHIWVMMG